MALALEVKGLLNVQMAVKGEDIYVIEINPRASRTVPYVSKATGVPLARMAAKVSMGKTLKELGLPASRRSMYRGARSRKRCCRSTGSLAWIPSSAPK
jgi:carbamoyl-phosphate synthase large subunit